MQTSNNEGKKVLLRVSNLKQYFPLKKKGLYVKANDGITLDIYEGETFGLVGESGCGKSTLGRTLLQLYRQTDGRTMYYGRTLDDLAPVYVKKTLQTLEKRREKWHELKKHLANVQKEYDALPDGEAKYKKHNELDKAVKDENDALLDMANLIGGFVCVKDIQAVQKLFLEEYRISKERVKEMNRRGAVQLDLDDLLFDIKKAEEKIKELQDFISRFSANKSKSKQATARRKLLDKLTVEEMPASSRRYPFVGFKMDREPGKEILAVEGLTKTVDGRKVLDNVSFRVNKGDKIAFVGEDEIATTTLFKILMEELEPDAGTFKWGTTITTSYFPLDNSAFFNDCDLNLVDWLGQYTADNAEEGTESFKRSFLGRMLFSGDDVYKPVKVLSGGEKVRCMLSRMMLFGSNALVLDQPTNHLDLESITAVNNGLIDFKGVVLFASHDHEFVQTIANRVMEFVDGKLIDKMCTYDAYIAGAREEMLARLNG